MRARKRVAFGVTLLSSALLSSVASCKHDADRVAAFVAAIDLLAEASCECGPSSGACREGGGRFSECMQRVLREHEAGLTRWLECATRATRDQAACLRKTDCGAVDDGACEEDADDLCGEPPESVARAIELDIERSCPKQIECDDGSSAQGNFCDGQVECEDGSDEAFCDASGSSDSAGSSDAGGSSSAGVAGAGMPAVPVAGGPSSTPAPSTPPPTDAEIEMCAQLAPAPVTLNPTCVSCLCRAAPSEALACDVSCWELLACMVESCPDLVPGSSEQTQCAVENCQESLGGAMPAMALGPVLRGACTALCPPF